MQFILTGNDGTDPQAPERRMNSRPAHLENIASMKKNGWFVFGGAILTEAGNMAGSVIVYDVPDRAFLDKLLESEPYIINKVWVNFDIKPFRVAVIA
jgi:uncharacterized protein YciI